MFINSSIGLLYTNLFKYSKSPFGTILSKSPSLFSASITSLITLYSNYVNSSNLIFYLLELSLYENNGGSLNYGLFIPGILN